MSAKLRILQVVSYYKPSFSFGGPPRVMFDLARELVKRGHFVTVYTSDILTPADWKARIGGTLNEDNITIRRFPISLYANLLPTKFLKLWVTNIDKQCEAEMNEFDIVHIAEISTPLTIKCSYWATKLNKPYAISVFGNLSTHQNPVMRILRWSFDYLWGRKIMKEANALLVQTEHEGKICEKYTSFQNITTSLLPIDMASFQNLPSRGLFRKKYSIGEEEKVILFLGRINWSKGLRLLAQAFAELIKKHHDNYRLVIAGTDDGYTKFLTKFIKILGIEERVIFTGPTFGQDKLEAYVDADVFVTIPKIYEETSLAALEACACHLPVIISEHNMIPGLEEYNAGFQIGCDNKNELKATLVKVLNDGPLRKIMGQNARKLIEERYTLAQVADRLENIFTEIIQNKVPASEPISSEASESQQKISPVDEGAGTEAITLPGVPQNIPRTASKSSSSTKMRILQVIPYFAPAWDYGGPVRVAYSMSKELVRIGHEVTVYTTDALSATKRTGINQEIIEGIKIKRFPNLWNRLAYRDKIFVPSNMSHEINNEIAHFDIIHMHEYRTLQNLMVYPYARRYDIPYLLQAHGAIPFLGNKQMLKFIYDKFYGKNLLRDAAKLIALTPIEVGQFNDKGVSKNRIVTIPNGIDLAEFKNLPERGKFKSEHGLRADEKVVLYLGRINRIKGLAFLVKAFAALSKEVASVRLVIIGPDENYLNELTALARRLALKDRIIFKGPIYGSDRIGPYVDADVCVLPSVYDTFPVSVLEALACGTPVIVSSNCGIAEIIHARSGYAVANDISILKDTMARILTNPTLANKLGENGKKLVTETYNWSHIARMMEQVYLEVKAANQ